VRPCFFLTHICRFQAAQCLGYAAEELFGRLRTPGLPSVDHSLDLLATPGLGGKEAVPPPPPSGWTRAVAGGGATAHALTDPVGNIHNYFYVKFAAKGTSGGGDNYDNGGVELAPEERGVLLSAPSESVRQIWVDVINGKLTEPVGEGFLG